MNNKLYPDRTAVSVQIGRLIKLTEKRATHERASSRMVKCAAAMEEGEFVGWQMLVPTKGLVKLFLFGTEALCEGDLQWILEKTGKSVKPRGNPEIDDRLDKLYETFLPVSERHGADAAIGFGRKQAADSGDSFGNWPTYYAAQFEALVSALRTTGAALRCVVGPAGEAEGLQCRKDALRTYSVSNIPLRDYLGHPVRIRMLLRLSAPPSVRLQTVVEECVQGAKLRLLGTMDQPEARGVWQAPAADAAVLPDYAARFLIMEPEIYEAVVGIESCEEEVKKLPADHKNAKDRLAVTIGRATDTSGVRMKVSIAEADLRRHYQIVGQTGCGKSTLLSTLILSAIERGHGLTFFDPHGSTIDVVLRALPEQYAERVRVVRIGDPENAVPLNIWDSDDPMEEERNISDLCELFADIFNPPGECFVGPRWERWFTTFAKASIAFLGRRASLESIAVISQSQDNMLKVSKAIYDRYPELVETIKQEYGLDRSSDWHATLSWFLCKFQRLISVEQLRKTLGAGTNALDFCRSIDSDTVTLIDLASPGIGTQAARMIGTLLLMKLWNAALARRQRDRTHLVVVDEASLFQTNPMPRMLAESRKFGISMVLCHQHTGQLTAQIRDALEANSANFSAFRLSPKDAATAAVRFDDPRMQTFLTRLDAFNAISSLSVNGKQTAPFTLETVRPKRQKDGERIARRIEQRSVETLVEPYRRLRALTAAEIQKLLEHPEKVAETYPAWLRQWAKSRDAMKKTG